MSTQNILLASAILVSIICSWATVHVVGLSPNKKDDSTNNQSTTTSINFSNKHDGKYLNYVRLLDGQCFNCSTYKCTTHKANMGGSEWCIMLFPDALAHCDSDADCGGYTMTTARWFHEQYDKNGQVAVHLTKAGEKTFNCSFTEWSSYEKQNTIRDTPVVYGKTTCPTANNFNYVFDSTPAAKNDDQVYSCQNHPQNQDDTNVNCILLMSEGITHCNSDDQCQGFAINTDPDWQEKYSKNGMQAVQLFGQGAVSASNEMWRIFKKQA
ncbi:unnamed protein product [Adineta ricciae]|uniref:Uncharacterized protein n=1 Tax=Adineta ricciae TaxID=249248 RepID=A0A814Y1Q8_ADIRI|nr:unnamed protein product [Adineta ricciae]CAF1377585.1 unnamed protein product [Adineta ricciae]